MWDIFLNKNKLEYLKCLKYSKMPKSGLEQEILISGAENNIMVRNQFKATCPRGFMANPVLRLEWRNISTESNGKQAEWKI